jgi:hypothetical protein
MWGALGRLRRPVGAAGEKGTAPAPNSSGLRIVGTGVGWVLVGRVGPAGKASARTLVEVRMVRSRERRAIFVDFGGGGCGWMRRSGKGMLVCVMAEGEESDGREHCVWRFDLCLPDRTRQNMMCVIRREAVAHLDISCLVQQDVLL